MAEEDDNFESEDEEGEGSQSSTASKKKLLWLLLPIFSVVAIVIGLYFTGVADSLLTVAKTEEKDSGADQKQIENSTVFFDVPELLINLSVKPGQKPIYVKIKVTLEMALASDVEQAEKMLPRIIDSLQFYLREMRMEEIQGSGGSYRLNEEIQGRLNRILSPVRVVDVLFKEFLIQ